MLIRFKYHVHKGDDKGVIRRYIRKVTGYSRSHVSKLIVECKRIGRLKKTEYRRHRFPWMYTPSEVELLVRTDELPQQSLGYLGPIEYIEKQLAKLSCPLLPMWSASTRY